MQNFRMLLDFCEVLDQKWSQNVNILLEHKNKHQDPDLLQKWLKMGVAFKHMHILHQSFLTFSKYSKQKILTKFQFKFLSLPP